MIIMKKKISHIIMMGDSLSDRSTVDRRYILGFIPMSLLSGLHGASPKGRFSNGYVWADVISSFFASDFLIKEFKEQYGYSNDDIADAIIHHDKRVTDQIKYDYNLDDDLYVKYEGRDFIRSYDEGGLSAYDYSWMPSTSINRFFSRLILATLEDKRKKLLAYDKEHNFSLKQKAETLVIEWSGANDLITLNARPSKLEVDRAVKERVKNLEVLIKNGYRNFVWFNLPDLTLTPRFQNMTGADGDKERDNAHQCSVYFNEQLVSSAQKLHVLHPYCSFDVFDINKIFTDAYNNPNEHGLDPDKLKQPYKDSPDFKILPNKTSPAKGYMFWDDVHPTADVQAVLANEFYNKYRRRYQFSEPNEREEHIEKDVSSADLCKAFSARYAEKLAKDQQGFFGSCRKSHIRYKEANLQEILKHALCEHGTRTREVITELQWIDKAGKLNLKIPVLDRALSDLQAQEPSLAAAVA